MCLDWPVGDMLTRPRYGRGVSAWHPVRTGWKPVPQDNNVLFRFSLFIIRYLSFAIHSITIPVGIRGMT